ncbi:Tricarboxylate transport membrane protein TctA (plasmid) [Sinorhizobium fredii CCBAU 25509]|nr:Tricarboxylate transport membrane protein TctA [Sinorhizobium fredii CCBAU 25509]
MLAGFQQYNIQPGPLLFTQHADLVLVASLFIANVMLLVLNLPLVGLWVKFAAHSAALALWRHPGLRLHGNGRRQSVRR